MNWMGFVAEQWMLIALLAAMAIAYFVLDSKKGGKTLSHHEVTRLLNKDQAILVDIREGKDFKGGSVSGAIHIPFASMATRCAELEKYKERQVILADKMGQHAGAAGKILRDKGFDVARLAGGMVEWQAQNLPVVKT